MKKYIIQISQIVLSLAFIPLYFIKFLHEVGVFEGQDANGNFITDRRDFYYSPYKNLLDAGLEKYMYLSLALIAASLITAILCFAFKNSKRLRCISYAIFVCSALVFIAVIAFSSTLQRCY